MYIGRQLAWEFRWNKSMQRSTLNCKSSINRIKSNLPICIHLCIYLQIYFYFAWKVLWNIFIYPPERGKGRLPSRPARPQPHKNHTRPGSEVSGPLGLSALWGRWVLQQSLWSPTLGGSRQSVLDREEPLMTHESAFTHELDSFICAWARLLFFFLSIHWIAQHVGSH